MGSHYRRLHETGSSNQLIVLLLFRPAPVLIFLNIAFSSFITYATAAAADQSTTASFPHGHELQPKSNRADLHYQKNRRFDPANIEQQHSTMEAANIRVTLSDGDIVSCIPINEQPAINKDSDYLPIQLQPSMLPKPGNSTAQGLGSELASQRFALEFGACPVGTIPIRDTTLSPTTAAAAASTAHETTTPSPPRSYTRAAADKKAASSQLPLTAHVLDDDYTHEHAFAYIPIVDPPSYEGTEVIINVWEPHVGPSDFSLAQLWFINTGTSFPVNSPNYNVLNTIEAGWQVYADLYGDNHPRLFIYWTADDYQSTGCYNLNQECTADSPGFVQVSNKVLIGGSIYPTSSLGSTQYEIKLLVFKDHASGNWWLQFNDEIVGYWPRSLFNTLKNAADAIDWGGEIIWDGSTKRGVFTDMGSGEPAALGYERAAYQRNLQYVGIDNALHDVTDLQVATEAPSCYTAVAGHNKPWGSFFYFGGSGSQCNF
ncbi:unnamed protein product [Sphagnum tenellum]